MPSYTITNNTHDLINITLITYDPIKNPGKLWAPIVVPIFFAILLIAGLIGNLTIIYIILRHKYMQITPNLYIMNLAIGNLLLLIFSAPFTALTYIFDTYPFGVLLCKIDQISQNLTLGVTIFTLMALSYDRCSSIRDPIVCHTNKSNRTRRSRIGIALIWTSSIVFCIPDGILTTIVNVPKMLNTTDNSTISIMNHELNDILKNPQILNNQPIGGFLNSNITKITTSTVAMASKLLLNSTFIHDHDTYIQVCYPFYEINHDHPHIYMKVRVVLRFLIYFLIPILIIGTFYIIIAVVLLRPFNMMNTVDNLIETIEENNKNRIQQQQQQQQASGSAAISQINNVSFKKKTNKKQRPLKKAKRISLYSATYDNTTNSEAATDILELKNLNNAGTSNPRLKLNSVSSMRSSTANYIVNRRHIKARLKIVKMVLFLVLIFILLCLPEHLFFFIWYFTRIPFDQGLLIFRIICSCAFYAHASVHAYVLFCLSSKFRYYGHNLILKCNKKFLKSKHHARNNNNNNVNNYNNSKKQSATSPQRPKQLTNNRSNHINGSMKQHSIRSHEKRINI